MCVFYIDMRVPELVKVCDYNWTKYVARRVDILKRGGNSLEVYVVVVFRSTSCGNEVWVILELDVLFAGGDAEKKHQTPWNLSSYCSTAINIVSEQ